MEKTVNELALERLERNAAELDEADKARHTRYEREDASTAAIRADEEASAAEGRKACEALRQELQEAIANQSKTPERIEADRADALEARVADLEAKLAHHASASKPVAEGHEEPHQGA